MPVLHGMEEEFSDFYRVLKCRENRKFETRPCFGTDYAILAGIFDIYHRVLTFSSLGEKCLGCAKKGDFAGAKEDCMVFSLRIGEA